MFKLAQIFILKILTLIIRIVKLRINYYIMNKKMSYKNIHF